MKLGIALDGTLCDKQTLFADWERRLGNDRFVDDAAFWAALKPYSDVLEAIPYLEQHDLYVFVERPKSLYLPTRAWVRNNLDITLPKDRIIMQALKRYDCRINGIRSFIDADGPSIENLKTELYAPITTYYLDRQSGTTLSHIMEKINAV